MSDRWSEIFIGQEPKQEEFGNFMNINRRPIAEKEYNPVAERKMEPQKVCSANAADDLLNAQAKDNQNTRA